MTRQQNLALFSFPFAAMGSPCEIELYASCDNDARVIAEKAIVEVRRLEARYSRYRADSLLSEINRVAACGGHIEVDAETSALLNYADTCFEQSDGLFDITSGILRRVWRFDRQVLPAPEDIHALLAHIGWHKVSWRSPVIGFPKGMEIDFGGIVKEYAADRASSLCLAAGIRHGVINLGGDIRIIGPHPDGSPWRIGIQNPRGEPAAIGALSLRSGGVTTSGDYARCLVIDGVRYGHVLNPLTGWPVRHMASVTVVGDFCLVAGSASTIAMLKEDAGPRWLEELGLPHFWLDVDGRHGGSMAS